MDHGQEVVVLQLQPAISQDPSSVSFSYERSAGRYGQLGSELERYRRSPPLKLVVQLADPEEELAIRDAKGLGCVEHAVGLFFQTAQANVAWQMRDEL